MSWSFRFNYMRGRETIACDMVSNHFFQSLDVKRERNKSLEIIWSRMFRVEPNRMKKEFKNLFLIFMHFVGFHIDFYGSSLSLSSQLPTSYSRCRCGVCMALMFAHDTWAHSRIHWMKIVEQMLSATEIYQPHESGRCLLVCVCALLCGNKSFDIAKKTQKLGT